jgi:hypothetical protein
VTFGDMDGGNGPPDIIVTSSFSGEVDVLPNDGTGHFSTVLRYRADAGPASSVGAQPNLPATRETRDGTSGVVVGAFLGLPGLDAVAVNGGSGRLAFLSGAPSGGLDDPALGPDVATGADPVVEGFFNGDGNLDVAVLSTSTSTISIFLGDGKGHFTLSSTVSAGNDATGLSVADVTRPGGGGPDKIPDLLVGNKFGDLLILAGKGDGTFAPYRRADDSAPLDVNAPAGVAPVVLVGNQAQDSVTVQQRVAGTNSFTAVFTDNRTNPNLLAPGVVVWANIDGHTDGLKDAIVASSGGNSVLIYHNTPKGLLPPVTLFVGTNPSAVLITDLNGDKVPDLIIADTGSNEVSVIFGSFVGGQWTATPGPRLAAGPGPSGLALLPNGDLAVTDGQAGQVLILPSKGGGFFDDAHPQTLTVSSGPIHDVIVPGTTINLPGGSLLAGQSALALTDDGRVIGFDLATGATQTVFTPPPGQAVNALSLQVLADGTPALVTANLDNSVSLLTDTNGQGFVAQVNIANVTPGTPSALEALENADGSFDVYLTAQGDSTPIVLTLDLRAELTGPGAGAGENVTGGLSLVAVLVTDVAVTQTATANQGPAAETFSPFALALSQAVDTGLLAPGEAAALAADEQLATLGQVLATLIVAPGGGGDNPGDEAPDGAVAAERPTLEQFLTDFMGALERLRDGAANETDDELIEGVRVWLQGWIDNWQPSAPQPPQEEAPEAPPEAPAVARPGPEAAVALPAEDAVFVLLPTEAGETRKAWSARRDSVSALLAGAALVAGAQALAGDAVAPRRGRRRLTRP